MKSKKRGGRCGGGGYPCIESFSQVQTCNNSQNTSIPPGVLSFQSWICRQNQTAGRHVLVVDLAISNPASTTSLGAGFNI